MAISEQVIMKKLSEYISTDFGKKRVDDTIKRYVSGSDSHVGNSGKTYGGGRIVTQKQMSRLAKEFLSILRTAAASSGMPESVMEHIESFDHTHPYNNPDGSMGITVYMTDSASRPSLDPGRYPDGVDDIVVHLNAGYYAKDSVYGMWHGVRTKSLQKREGAWFIQKAVDEFLNKYGNEYDVDVVIDSKYNGAFTGD